MARTDEEIRVGLELALSEIFESRKHEHLDSLQRPSNQ